MHMHRELLEHSSLITDHCVVCFQGVMQRFVVPSPLSHF